MTQRPKGSSPDGGRAQVLRRSALRRAAARTVTVELLEPRRLLSGALLKDINPVTSVTGTPRYMAAANNSVFFNFNTKLWKSDGTAAGTYEIAPTVYNPSEILGVGDTAYFGALGQLFKSDGTAAGTVAVSPVAMSPRDIIECDGRLFFRGSDAGGDELWTSDGTAAGTVRVKDINPGAGSSVPRGFAVVNHRVYFRASDGSSGDELWTSDGTAAGTVRVKDINPGAGSSGPSFLTNVNGTLFFSATDGASGYELWTSDGTAAGTVRVNDIRPGVGGSAPTEIVNVAGKAMFIANDGTSGLEIWQSDGTSAGTTLVRDIVPGAAGALVNNLTAVGSTLFFTAHDDVSGEELWKSDGTVAGTEMVKNIAPFAVSSNPTELTSMPGGKLFFLANSGPTGLVPWVSDGTAAGTFQLAGISSIDNIVTTPTRVYFAGYDANGPGLFASDGAVAGTALVTRPTSFFPVESDIAQITNVNGVGYFTANDSIHGRELWKSDGSAAGTVLVADLTPGGAWSYIDQLTNVAGTLFFQANGRIWKTDGTAAGTVTVGAQSVSNVKLTAAGSTLYFTASSSSGSGLWKSDGTDAGTVLVKPFDVNAWKPESLTGLSTGAVALVADDGTHGFELWRSDGTNAGTVMVKDIIPGSASSGPLLLTEGPGGRVLFRANDGVHGYELWASDGTATGTVMLKDIRAGSDGSVILDMTRGGGGIVYFAGDDGVNGQELWRSDGTPAGTYLLKDINPGAHGSSPGTLVNSGGVLYFRADDGVAGNELWKSDGTAAGTVMLKDILPGPSGSGLGRMVPVSPGGVVFVANDGVNGFTTWQSDGTAAGTVSGYAFQAEAWGGIGSFSLAYAWSAGGYELVKIDLTPPPAPSPGAALPPAPTTAPPAAPLASSPQSEPSSTGIVYDATSGERQNTAFFGYLPFRIDYGSFWASFTDQSQADESSVRRLADQAAGAGVPLCLNLEIWPNDLRSNSESVVGVSTEKLMQVIDWIHDEQPTLQVGYAGIFPHGAYLPPQPGTIAYQQWHAANERMRPLAEKVDLFFPGIYAQDENPNNWLAYARGHIAENNLFGKPTYPLIFMDYEGGTNTGGRKVPPELWRMMLDTTQALTGKTVVWGNWSEDPWDLLTRDFIADPDPMSPAAPTTLVAAADQTSNRITLSWQDRSYNETGFRIERRLTTDVTFSPLASVAADVTSYNDATAMPGVAYVYRVVATNSGGDSLASNESTAKIRVVPPPPTGVAAVALSSRRARISWSESFDDVENFIVERSTSGGAFGVVATLAADVFTYDDGGLAPGTAYTYRVRAANAIGQSAPSPQANVTTPFTDTGMRAHWALDETTGTSAGDSAGAGHVGTLVGSPAHTSGGQLGRDLTFDGIDDHVIIPDAADLLFASTDDFSVSLWVNLATLPNKLSAVLVKGSGASAYGVWLDAGNHWVAGSSAGVGIVGPTATTGWTHLAFVQDGAGGTRKLYVNGTLAAGGASADANAAGELWIGGNPAASQFFTGQIDDVRIYAKSLSASDAAALADPHIVLAGGTGNDAWTIQLNAAGDTYQFTSSGGGSLTRPADSVGSVTVTGGAGDDQLTVDFTDGDPTPLYGFTFDGGGSGADTLTLRGDVTDLFNITGSAIQRALGTLTYSNIETLDLNQGQFLFPTDFASATSELRVDANATALFNTTQHLTSLNLTGSASLTPGTPKTLLLKSLSITGAGRLDLTSNALALDYTGASALGSWNGSSYTGISGLITSGRAQGAWTGSGIVTSQTDAIDPNTLTTIGVAEATDVLGIAPNQTALWRGQTIDGTTVLVKYTYAADANLDGVITGDDYFQIDSAFPQRLHGFVNGDFNYDGEITGDDYFLIDSVFPAQGLPL